MKMATYYTYDSNNRLKTIKDAENSNNLSRKQNYKL